MATGVYGTDLLYDWDGVKGQANLEKHGVDFTAMASFEWATSVTVRSDRHGEIRFLSIGYIGDRLHTAIYTMRLCAVKLSESSA